MLTHEVHIMDTYEALKDMIVHAKVNRTQLRHVANETGLDYKQFSHNISNRLLPTQDQLFTIQQSMGVSPLEYKLLLGAIDSDVTGFLRDHAQEIACRQNGKSAKSGKKHAIPSPKFSTKQGKLYRCDCLHLMQYMEADSVDLIFADPPFNLDKLYPSGMDDDLKTHEYLHWCEQWLAECARVLRPGGSLLVWNLPKWNTHLASFLNHRLTFRHWISVDIKYSLPIASRLYPSHYALLYYCKGPKPRVFHPDRMPMPVCPHCCRDLRDYGGYKSKMNPKGVNLADVWTDIPPVRHAKYKRRKSANELSVRLLDRVIEMASDRGDVVFDPFGGSGTTYAVAEIKGRKWIGCEIGPLDDIVTRFDNLDDEREYLGRIRADLNCLFTDKVHAQREECGLWTVESVRPPKKQPEDLFSLLK